MAKRAKKKESDIDSYRHETDKRKNAVPASLAFYDTSKPKPQKYKYDSHLAPQLVRAGKAERTLFEVPTVSLHIHERILLEAIIREYPQQDLFAKLEMTV